MTYGPLRHYTSGVLDGTVVDPRFGEDATPTQPAGWGGGGGAANLPLVDVAAHGAVGDGRDVTASVSGASGSTTVTAGAGSFTSADVGKTVWVLGGSSVHKTTVTAATGTNLTLAAALPFAVSNGVVTIGTDNGTALAAAVNAAKQYGQAGVQLGPGLYLTDAVLPALTYTRDFRIAGAGSGGMSYGYYTNMDTAPGTELRYMGSAAGSFLDASYTRGFQFGDMAMRYAHPGYTGRLVNLDHTWGSYWTRFLIGGVWNGKNATLFYDPRTMESQFTNGMIERAAVAFDSGTGYNNASSYTAVVWLACGVSMKGRRTQPTFVGCVWEPQGGSMNTDPIDAPSPVEGLLQGATFIGCGWWDAQTASGPWIKPATGSANVVIIGGYYEPRTSGEVLVQVDGTLEGLTIHGLRTRGYNHTSGSRVVALGASGQITNLDYRGNTYNSTSTSGLDTLTGKIALEPDTGFRTVVAYGNASSSLSLRTTATQTVTLTGNPAVTFPTLVAGTSMTLDLFATQDGTGGRTPTWPGSVRWDGGAAPTLNTTAGATTHLQFTTVNGGTTWLGRKVGAYAA